MVRVPTGRNTPDPRGPTRIVDTGNTPFPDSLLSTTFLPFVGSLTPGSLERGLLSTENEE